MAEVYLSNSLEELAIAEAAQARAFYKNVIEPGVVNGETCVRSEADLPRGAASGAMCWALDDEALWVCWPHEGRGTMWVHPGPPRKVRIHG